MKTFLEFHEERKLTPAGRVKKGIAIRKHRYKLKNRAAIAKRIGASTRRLNRRTKMAAIRDIYKTIIKRNMGKLSSTQKAEAERLMNKRGKIHLSTAIRKQKPKLRGVDTKRKKS
jgi:hypothetical protein